MDLKNFKDVFLIEQAATVDGDVLKGVVLHGPTSNNGNEYSLGAMRSLVPLLEGRAVYVNHRIGQKMRDVHERFGHVANVRVIESDHDGKPRVRGDLHFMRSHKDAPQIIESYTKGAPYYGTSIVADGVGRKENGKRYVEQVTKLSSLDLVDRAATGSLVEQDEGDEPPPPMDPAAHAQDGMIKMVTAIMMDTTLDKAAKLKKLEALLEMNEPAEPPAPSGETPPPMSEATLRKVMGELVEQTVARALTTALPQLVEQETQRRAQQAQYVKPTTPPGAPPHATPAKDEPPKEPAARKAWLHSN